MDAFSRTPSRLGRLKSQVKTVFSRPSSSSSDSKPTRIQPIKRHTAPSSADIPRIHASSRSRSELPPSQHRGYRHAHPESANAYIDPYASVHPHYAVSGTFHAHPHRHARSYPVDSPLTPGAYALLDEYFAPHSSAGPARPPSTSSRPPSRPSSAFERPATRRPQARPAPTTQTSPSRTQFALANETELAAHLSDPYYKFAGARLPARPRGARPMPDAAVVPVYVNVYGTGGGKMRGWLGGGRRK